MSAKPEWVPPDMNVWLATTETETDSMCGHALDSSWIGGHHCPDMPWRVWLGPIMIGRIDRTPFAHYGECGWTIGVAGLFVSWTGWTS
jgi:hypothetical protein